MRDYIRSIWPFFGLVALVPLLIGLIEAFSPGLGFVLFILGIPLTFVVLVVVAGVRFVRGIACARQLADRREQALTVLASPVLLVATVLVAWPLLALGSHAGDFARLTINRDHYEAIIAEARVTQRAAWFEDHDGVTYSVDLGPPVRVAFNPAGFLDNWSGIIFDPTGEVMLADRFDPNTGEFAAPERITELFGGDLVACRHLWDSYYSCSFT